MASAALQFALNNPWLMASILGNLIVAIYAWSAKGDAKLLASLESMPAIKAHPDAVAVVERMNAVAMGMLKTAQQVALTDVAGASQFNEALAEKIARDTLAKVRDDFGQTNIAKAAAGSGGEAKLTAGIQSLALSFIKAKPDPTTLPPPTIAPPTAPKVA